MESTPVSIRTSTAAAAFSLALALGSTAAWADTKASSSATKPVAASQSDQPQGAKQQAGKTVGATAATASTAAAAATQRGRDWGQIDTNGDGLISPEELGTWIAPNPGPQRP